MGAGGAHRVARAGGGSSSAGLVVVGVPLTVLSGSRSAWLAWASRSWRRAIPWAWRGGAPRRRRRLGLGRADDRLALLASARRAVGWRSRSSPAADRGHVADLPRQPVARHARGVEHRPAARHRPRVHALRPAGGAPGLHVPGPPAALRTTCRSACSATRGCWAWPRPSSWWRRCRGRRPVADANAGRDGGELPAHRARRRRAVRGPDVRARLQPARDRPGGRRADRCRRRGSSPHPAPAHGALAWRRPSAAVLLRDGRRRRGAIAYRTGSTPPPRSDWDGAHLLSSGPSRSTPGTRPVRSRWRSPPMGGARRPARDAAETALELVRGDANAWVNLALSAARGRRCRMPGRGTDRAVAKAARSVEPELAQRGARLR